MVSAESIQKTLESRFTTSEVNVLDMTGGGDHFQVEVVSAAFQGKSLLEQHRMVYAALGRDVGVAIHALALKTRAA